MYPSRLSFSGRDKPLTQLWNSRQSGLMERIMEAAKDAYNAIDILRVYMNGDFHETLMISVNPDSLSWERGYVLAMRCKAMLEEYGIHNVHCEIRESVTQW
jgi:hypothetical protein